MSCFDQIKMHLNIKYWEVKLIIYGIHFTFSFSSIIMGIVSDRIGKRKIIVIIAGKFMRFQRKWFWE